MQLDGYIPVDVTPWETASGGRAAICTAKQCSAQITWDKPDGLVRRIACNISDLSCAATLISPLSIAGNEVDHWIADDTLLRKRQPGRPHINSSRVVHCRIIHRGDISPATGWPDGPEPAPLDYVEIVPAHASEATK